ASLALFLYDSTPPPVSLLFPYTTLFRSRADGGARRLRVRPRGVRLPRNGPGDDRGRLVRSGHRQRAVDLRAVGHRDAARDQGARSEEHTSELQSRGHLVYRLLLEKKNDK